MKYSIFVLGATISISLFVRICCAIGLNNSLEKRSLLYSVFNSIDELEVDRIFSGRTEDTYEKMLVLSILNGEKTPPSRQHVERMVRQWREELEAVKIRNWKLRADTKTQEKTFVPNNFTENFDNVDIYCSCQRNQHPPTNLVDPDCDSDPLHHICVSDLPSGCDYNNETRAMKCNDEQITSIPPLPPDLAVLDLDETSINALAAHAIVKVSINYIRLFRNPIEFIHPSAFAGVKNLHHLIIQGNDISCVSTELYVGLNSLIVLDLSYNHISFEIYKTCPIDDEDNIIQVLPNLLTLKLTGNPLKAIPKQMFAGLRNSKLSLLYLDDCHLTEIHPDAFSYVNKVESLSLSNNPPELMTSLESFLKNLPYLRQLSIAGNRITNFPRKALQRFGHHLRTLDISGSILGTLSREDIEILPALEELYLDDAGLVSIADDAFEGSNIRVLSLKNNNKLRQIPSVLPESLHTMIVSGEFISVRQNVFQKASNLSYLSMEGVSLEKITNTTFASARKLRTMTINDGNIKEIEEGAFQNLLQLGILNLANNPISKLPVATLSGLEELTQVNLSNCTIKLTIEEAPIFPYLPNLVTLDLSNNEIESLIPAMFQNLPILRNLHLSNNPVKPWSLRLFPERDSKSFVTGYTFVVKIDGGKIQSLTDAMLQDFEVMTTIDLSKNQIACNRVACQLRDLITNDTTTPNANKRFTNSENYECFDDATKSFYNISKLTDDICEGVQSQSSENPADPVYVSSGMTKIISICAALAVIVSVVIVLAYKNRAHLRYFLFYFKFHVMPLPHRKAKLSTMDEDDSVYDFDVFISYHKQDAMFIEEVFLPEIELRDDVYGSGQCENNLNEARNVIYFIGNDKNNFLTNNESSISVVNHDKEKSKEDVKRFRVCLHERDFVAGVSITENIVDCVDRSRKTAIFVSREYMESQWCSFELNLVYHRMVDRRRKAFVLVLMEEIPQNARSKVLNYLMASKTYLQWPGVNASEEDKAIFWRRLRSFLKAE